MHQTPRSTTLAIPSAPVPDTYPNLGISQIIFPVLVLLMEIIMVISTFFNMLGIWWNFSGPGPDTYHILEIVEILFGCIGIFLEIFTNTRFCPDSWGMCYGIIVST